ncbi:phenylacetate-CoA ligase [Marinobacter pelagius]|uniref:Phenylacetate-CoA ligase n=2 Tax=Marinobacter pelagius TaxID=379482 RepID=A0A1I4T0L1_9GAMM|nr:phenylacetate-CoA ligase [Marinobacter pelagius]
MGKLRYLLTRMFFFSMGLRVEKWRREVGYLWSLGIEERNSVLERILQANKPINAEGAEVTSLSELKGPPSLNKKQYQRLNCGAKTTAAFKRKTSGTTGEPTSVTLSREELSRMLGVRDYCFRQYGVRVGDREARFWGRPEYSFKSNLKNFVLNRKVCFPSGEQDTDSLVKTLNSAPDYLYGYASLLLEAAALIEKNSISFKPPKCVICTAETILPAQKEYLERVFNAPVVEEYGATEFDIVAFECKEGHRHFVNPWLIIRESEDSLLITDVSRKSSSIVNYELGDTGYMDSTDCGLLGDSIYLRNLTGRSVNRFVYIDSETKFHSVNISYAINDFQKKEQKIFSFKIIQDEYGVVDLYVSVELSYLKDILKRYIEEYIKDRTGNKVVINIFDNKQLNGYTGKSYFIQNICMSNGATAS